MKLTVCTPPLSNNHLLRMHWAVKSRLRARLGKQLLVALSESFPLLWGHDASKFLWGPAPTKEVEKKNVTLHLYLPRRYDPDNAMGGQKVLIDAMRDIGLIPRDSAKWLRLKVEQHLSRKKYIVIEIEEGGEC